MISGKVIDFILSIPMFNNIILDTDFVTNGEKNISHNAHLFVWLRTSNMLKPNDDPQRQQATYERKNKTIDCRHLMLAWNGGRFYRSDCADHVVDFLDMYDNVYSYDRELWHRCECGLRRGILTDTHNRRLITKKFLNRRRKERQQTKTLDRYRFEPYRKNPHIYRKTQIKKSLTYFKAIMIPAQFTTAFIDNVLQQYHKLYTQHVRHIQRVFIKATTQYLYHMMDETAHTLPMLHEYIQHLIVQLLLVLYFLLADVTFMSQSHSPHHLNEKWPSV
jgi:hypothetical protein